MFHHISDRRRMFCNGFIFVLLFLLFISSCLVGAVENGGMKRKTTTLDNIMGHMNAELGRVKSKLDIHFISKRRVPNGPDPIHNRRAGNSRQPRPGRA
ncbi:hypothetical protein Leryth_020467 [Lithospermum erythrorhizon]|nr:hypothetical protein Leryth_020467 [Lithospermum erythrorhizon]